MARIHLKPMQLVLIAIVLVVIAVALALLVVTRMIYRGRDRYIPNLYSRDIGVYEDEYQIAVKIDEDIPVVEYHHEWTGSGGSL